MSETIKNPGSTGDFECEDEIQGSFPNLREIDIIKSRSSMHPSEDVQRRVINTELLLYALKQANPAINESTPAQKVLIKNIIDEIVRHMYRQDLEGFSLEAPADDQLLLINLYSAIDQMYEAGAIDLQTHNLLRVVASKINLDNINLSR